MVLPPVKAGVKKLLYAIMAVDCFLSFAGVYVVGAHVMQGCWLPGIQQV
jgi:hypothetical protein